MGKLLFWIVVIGAVWVAIKFAQASARRVERSARDQRAGGQGGGGNGGEASRARGGAAANAPHGEMMIRCAHCGVYFPQSDAVSAGALHYCSSAHRDAGPRAS